MSRSILFKSLARSIRIAHYCEENNISTKEGLERVADLEARLAKRRASRREFLGTMGKLAVAGAIGSVAWPLRRTLAAPASGPDVNIAIVGAGLAGLACGDELRKNGINATLYDATTESAAVAFH